MKGQFVYCSSCGVEFVKKNKGIRLCETFVRTQKKVERTSNK